MPDYDMQRFYRLLDSTKRPRPISGRACRVDCEFNNLNSIYLVVESIKLDSKGQQWSIAHPPNDGSDG
jgi:hypothetical protein